MTCQREKELLEQIEQTGQMYKVSALQLIKAGKRIAELEALNGALCRDSAGFVQERDALAAKNQALREAIDLLYSWANNWDSEFMNDPEWKDRDFEIIKNAIMPDLSADILRQRDAGVARDIATNWLPNIRLRESVSSLTKTAHNQAVDDCVKHILSYVAAKEANYG